FEPPDTIEPGSLLPPRIHRLVVGAPLLGDVDLAGLLPAAELRGDGAGVGVAFAAVTEALVDFPGELPGGEGLVGFLAFEDRREESAQRGPRAELLLFGAAGPPHPGVGGDLEDGAGALLEVLETAGQLVELGREAFLLL